MKEDIATTLVAFANADGGELLIGVEDDHQVTGIPDAVTEETLAQDDLERNVHKVFLANLHREASKGDIVDFLETDFRVLQLDLPPDRFFPANNRGYAFATLISNKSIEFIIQKLDGLEWKGRRLHCAPTRENN